MKVNNLTNNIRGEIANYLVARARNPGLHALRAIQNELFRKAVDELWESYKGHRSELDGLFPKRKELAINCGNFGRRSVELYAPTGSEDDTFLPPRYDPVGLAVPNAYSGRYDAIVLTKELTDRIVEVSDQIGTYETVTTNLKAQTLATLARLNTPTKFEEGWPEAYAAAQHLIPEKAAPPALPVRLNELNSALDLPV